MRFTLRMLGIIFLVISFATVGSKIGYAQSVSISGTVTSLEDGLPIPGVTVLVKGTTNGAVTDLEGSYSLTNVEPNALLVFSYIGYVTQEIAINARSKVDVVLEFDTSELNEFVVVGYGEQSREVVTAAISKISSAEINNAPSSHPVQALQGKVAGVSVNIDSGQPGAGAAIYIRGGTQPDPKGGTNEPLYVIDGMFREDLIGVNPMDIESIEVLKDAAASAIYGARAANGVILVTTKSGKGVQGSQINVQYAHGIDQVRTFDFTTARDYLDISRRSAARGVTLNSPGARLEDTQFGYSVQNISQQGEFGFERVAVTWLDELISLEGQDYVNQLLANGYHTMADPVTGRTLIFLDNELSDIRSQVGVTKDLNLSMQGSNNGGNYRVSIGYQDQEGTLKGTGANRFNALINGDFKAFENFTIHSGFSYEFRDIDQPRDANGTIDRSSRLPYTYRIWNDDGTPALGESSSSPRNLEHELYYQRDSRRTFRTSYRLGFDWEIIEGLNFRPNASVYRLENIIEQFELASREIQSRNMYRGQETNNQITLDGLLTYHRSFGYHTISSLVGTQFVRSTNEVFTGSGANAPTDLIPDLGASETERERVYSAFSENRLLSFFGRLSYDFDTRYLFEFSLRRDGSSRFSENNRWGTFPALSAGWNLHQEAFWNSSLLSKLKIRGSWGQAGNDNLSITDTRGVFNTTSYGLVGAVRTGGLPNYDLKWESTTSSDVGFDMGLFQNKVNLLIDFYNKVTSNRLINRPLPSQTGFGSIRSNFGSLRNRGVEVEVAFQVLDKEKLQWDLAMNWAFNQSRIIDLPENGRAKNRTEDSEVWDENGNLIEVGGLAEGERPYGIWAFQFLGVYQTDAEAAQAPDDQIMSGYYRSQYDGKKNAGDAIWRDVNGDNIIDNRDLVFIGYSDPTVRGGMVNTFRYSGFSLRVAMDWAMGHVINQGWLGRALGNARNNIMTPQEILELDIWDPETNPNGTRPRYDVASDFDNGPRNHFRTISGANGNLGINSNGTSVDVFYQKGDFLAFREVSLTYAFPPSGGIVGLSGSTLGLELYNLGYLTPFQGISPERYNGVESGQYFRPFQARIRFTATF